MESLSVRQRAIVSLALEGRSNKFIAVELDVAEQTVATHLSRALWKLGSRSRLHLISTYAERQPVGGDALSEAERAVVAGALAGLSNRDIAFRRRRSPRTVAHQLESAFRKLGVSSRAELVSRFAIP
jgi:DNA-binding NarL/FixJ family response regulator